MKIHGWVDFIEGCSAFVKSWRGVVWHCYNSKSAYRNELFTAKYDTRYLNTFAHGVAAFSPPPFPLLQKEPHKVLFLTTLKTGKGPINETEIKKSIL